MESYWPQGKKKWKRSVELGLFFVWKHVRGRCHTALLITFKHELATKVYLKLPSKQTITTIGEKNGCCRIEMRPCEHDRTVLSHPSTVPSPPDEARRLQPHTELVRVPALLLQVWRQLRRGAHRRIDRRVALQRAVEFCELLAEAMQRVAAAALDVCVLRVPPQGSQQRVRRGLRRQTRPAGRALQRQQAAQRARGFVRNVRVWASRRLDRSTSNVCRFANRFDFEKILFFIFWGCFAHLQRHNL